MPTLGSQLLSCSILVQLLTNWLELINFWLKKKNNGKKKTITSLSTRPRKGILSSTWKMWWSPLTRTPAHPCPVSKPSTSIPPPIGPTSLSWGKKAESRLGLGDMEVLNIILKTMALVFNSLRRVSTINTSIFKIQITFYVWIISRGMIIVRQLFFLDMLKYSLK